jgi:hypothetical protein
MSLLYELMVGHIMGTTIGQLNLQHFDSKGPCDRDKIGPFNREQAREE